jgi:hypothetical protein
MQWFSALIPAYQHIQKKEHDELDRVVGRERLPTVKDEGKLPYCHAIIKEVSCILNSYFLFYLFSAYSICRLRGATTHSG